MSGIPVKTIDKSSETDTTEQTGDSGSDNSYVTAAIDSAARLINAVRSRVQFAAVTIIAVIIIEIGVVYFFRGNGSGEALFSEEVLLIALGLPFLLIAFLAWLWAKTLQANESVQAVADGTIAQSDDDNDAVETRLEESETLHIGVKTVVLRAYDPGLRRHVVKKVLKSGGDREEFVDSTRSAIKLSDLPNFLKIYGARFYNVEAPYVIMQYLSQGSLRNYIDKNCETLPQLDEVRRIVHRVGIAVEAAHQRSVPVGNIKPTNILLDAENEPHLSPRIRLTFLSPSRLKDAVRDRQVTLEDIVYTAPEIFGSAGVDTVPNDLSDQYSLGILAYHLVTGSLPATLPTVGQGSVAMQVAKSCELVQKKGSAAFQMLPGMHTVRPGVPRQISAAFSKMVSLDPRDRYERLDIAIHAMHSAEQSILIAARDSYTRCLASQAERSFFECFYSEFTADKNIASHFAGMDSASWTVQHGKLQRAIDASFDFVKDFVATVDLPEPNAMSSYAQQHSSLGLTREDYNHFVDALVNTVCGINERAPFDPECNDSDQREEIARAWRELMYPVVRYFTATTV